MILSIECVILCIVFTLIIMPAQYKDPMVMIMSYPPNVIKRVEQLPQYEGCIKERKKKHISKKIFGVFFFAGILAVVLILSVTACDTRQKIYNNYTMHTVTSFGFTDDGKARVSVDYTGYRDTKGADIDVTIEKQGFLFFWD